MRTVGNASTVLIERETNDHDIISTDKNTNTDDDATPGSLSWLLHDNSRCHDRQCGIGRYQGAPQRECHWDAMDCRWLCPRLRQFSADGWSPWRQKRKQNHFFGRVCPL